MIGLDDCGRSMSSLAQAMRCLPVTNGNSTCDEQGNYNGSDPFKRGRSSDGVSVNVKLEGLRVVSI